MSAGYNSGWEAGWDEGEAQGHTEGYREGYDEAKAEFTDDAPDPVDCCAPIEEDPSYLDGYALGWQHGNLDRTPYKPLMSKRGLVNGFAIASIVWAIVGLFVLACPAQSPPIQAGSGAFNYGYVQDSARTYLEQGWDEKNAFQVERGYCIEPSDVVVDTASDHSSVVWRVHHVTLPERVTLATPYAISFHCSPTAIAAIHTHTPSTCAHNPDDPYGLTPKLCILGGEDAYLCSVDEADRAHARGDAFAVVQCGRGQFVFWWPGKRG